MDQLRAIVDDFWPALLVAGITALFIATTSWFARRSSSATTSILPQLLNWVFASIAVLVIVVLLPISNETQGQILSLLGVVLTAVIALSSTSFVSNAMAGIMLHITQPFRPGDYVRIKDEFGRVTKRTLIHTQIQTEWRDFTTLPNLFLTTNPFTVMHRDGTIISAEVSIGYDEPYTEIEDLLLKASAAAGLEEPFVLVQELLDHAVLYRVCGFLSEMKTPLSSRSNLRKQVLEQLHGNGVEIVSPSFMNQRRLDPQQTVIPEQPVLHQQKTAKAEDTVPEERIFDQAEQAASLAEIRQRHEETRQEIKSEKAHLKTLGNGERQSTQKKIKLLERKEERLSDLIKAYTDARKD